LDIKIYPIFTSRMSASKRTLILWVSRHRPLPAQILDLERRFGPIEIAMVKGTIPTAEFVAEVAVKLGASVVVAVLPLSFISELAKLSQEKGFTLLMAKMRKVYESPRQDQAVEVMKQAVDRRVVAKHMDGMYRVLEFEGFIAVREVKIVGESI